VDPPFIHTCYWTGVEILNGAIDVLNARVPAEKWNYVDVTVAPSTITIAKHEVVFNNLCIINVSLTFSIPYIKVSKSSFDQDFDDIFLSLYNTSATINHC